MFLENHRAGAKQGSLEVICGSMFSGKTEELLRRLKRSQIANQKIELFKPKLDSRYHPTHVVSHDQREWKSTAVPSSISILELVSDADVVGIDEAQFFDEELPNVCNQLAALGKRVIVAGLDLDFTGRPFGPIPQLMAAAEYVTKVQAICVNCGSLAYVSHRKSNNLDLVLLGERETYEPLCRICFIKERK